MTITMIRGTERCECVGDDGLIQSDPYYRACFERQVKLLTTTFYGPQGPPTPEPGN